MQNKLVSFLLENASKHILNKLSIKVFHKNSTLVYKGQVPNMALCLVEGVVLLEKERIFVQNNGKITLIALHEFIDKSVVPLCITVVKGAKIMILDREVAVELAVLKGEA